MGTNEVNSEKSVDPLARDNKIVFVCEKALAAGQVANRAAVLATGLTAKAPEIVGPDIQTENKVPIPGITKIPITMLTTNGTVTLAELYQKAYNANCKTLIYLSRAQGQRSYKEYSDSIQCQSNQFDDIDAILLYGPKKQINKLTGSLPLLR